MDTKPRLDPVYTRAEVAEALRITIAGLELLHRRGEGPPRYKVSPNHWGYPKSGFDQWQERKLKEAGHG